MSGLAVHNTVELNATISTFEEMAAYETLWAMPNETLKSIASMFKKYRLLPSQLLQQKSDLFNTPKLKKDVIEFLSKKKGFSVCVNGDFQYPKRLREAKYPVELFYYKGDLGLIDSRCISVVGARKSSQEGIKRTQQLVRALVEEKFTIVSGLAAGIDTAAMKTAIEDGGNTIGVIGTPIDKYYPKENQELQDNVAASYLLISQVPFYRYEKEPFTSKKIYFPQRNETMSALSEATVIIEASDTSGTLTQARACLAQNRKLFILNSCFENPNITWPKKYEEKGAIRVRVADDILSVLNKK
jgi:DNA processing protein